MTQKNANPWMMDVRVRERNLKAGTLTDKDVEKYVSQLPDLADQAEPFALSQPALEQPAPAPAPMAEPPHEPSEPPVAASTGGEPAAPPSVENP